MKAHIKFQVALLALSFSHICLAEEIDCNNLVGLWKGSYRFDETKVYWIADYRADGTLKVEFLETKPDGKKIETSQTGSWGCRYGILVTEVSEGRGEKKTFGYRILKLDDIEFVYQNFGRDKVGPTFSVKRIE